MCCALQKDDIQNAVEGLYNDVLNKQFMLNVEYRTGSQEYVSLLYSDNKEDVAQGLVAEGLLLVEKRKEKRLVKLVDGYRKAQDKAKAARVSAYLPHARKHIYRNATCTLGYFMWRKSCLIVLSSRIHSSER